VTTHAPVAEQRLNVGKKVDRGAVVGDWLAEAA
jgi:hypothetical protein